MRVNLSLFGVWVYMYVYMHVLRLGRLTCTGCPVSSNIFGVNSAIVQPRAASLVMYMYLVVQ